MKTHTDTSNNTRSSAKVQRGIHAMEVGGMLLQHVADAARPVSMIGLSAATKLPLNQVFTYMVSLVRSGLVRRDVMTHRYEPGPLALKLGLCALQQLYPVYQTIESAARLIKEENQGALVAIWTEHGPTVVQYHGPEMYLHVGLHVGSVMSLAHSSTGRLFCAYLPRQTVEPLLERELGDAERVGDAHANIFAHIRRCRLSRTRGGPIPGVDSLSSPVFDSAGQIRLALTIFGPSNRLDTPEEERVARGLLGLTEKLSQGGSLGREA
jgi:DNA-binding IclR family transcriptional regulator